MTNHFIPSSADLLAIIILCFLCYLIWRNKLFERKKTVNYLKIVLLTVLIIFLEILTGLFEHLSIPTLRIPTLLVNVGGFSLMFILPVLLSIFYSDKVYKKRFVILIPSFIGILLCICSIWTGLLFTVDQIGVYHRGPFFIICNIIAMYGFFVLMYSHYEMAKEYDVSEKIYLWILYIIILITSLVQVMNQDIEIMWSGIAITELLYYIFIRELQFKFDIVTEVRNRICFENHLSEIKDYDHLFLVEFDVNNLKKINDKYGHKAGDDYLRKSAEVIKKAYEACGMVYRIGGDEFAVIAPDCSEEKLINARKQMISYINQNKEGFPEDYYIANAFSRYDFGIHKNIQDCLRDADIKMYEDKDKSKNNTRQHHIREE